MSFDTGYSRIAPRCREGRQSEVGSKAVPAGTLQRRQAVSEGCYCGYFRPKDSPNGGLGHSLDTLRVCLSRQMSHSMVSGHQNSAVLMPLPHTLCSLRPLTIQPQSMQQMAQALSQAVELSILCLGKLLNCANRSGNAAVASGQLGSWDYYPVVLQRHSSFQRQRESWRIH